MPTIQWRILPPELLVIFSTSRRNEWRRHSPEAPEGRWFKDFGSFKLCGDGQYPKTFLLRGQVANGKEIE